MKPRPWRPASALKQPLSAGAAARGALGQSRALGGCLALLEKPAQRLCFIGEGGRSRLGPVPAAGSVLGASSGYGRASKTAATRRGEAKRQRSGQQEQRGCHFAAGWLVSRDV